MKVLIAYATKTGTAASCAEQLGKELSNLDVTLCDLRNETIAPDEFDVVILGSSVRFGRILPDMREYLKINAEILTKKAIGLFFCCALTSETEYYREHLYPKELTQNAGCVMTFGGTLTLKNASLRERFLLRMMRNRIVESEIDDGEYTPTLPGILPENIANMAVWIRQTAIEQ